MNVDAVSDDQLCFCLVMAIILFSMPLLGSDKESCQIRSCLLRVPYLQGSNVVEKAAKRAHKRAKKLAMA